MQRVRTQLESDSLEHYKAAINKHRIQAISAVFLLSLFPLCKIISRIVLYSSWRNLDSYDILSVDIIDFIFALVNFLVVLALIFKFIGLFNFFYRKSL